MQFGTTLSSPTAMQKPPMQHDMTPAMRACVAACTDSRDASLVAVAHSVERGGGLATPAHVAVLLDCALICETTAAYLLRGSPRHARLCDVCASVCRECEASCRQIGEGETLRRCADACRACAEACEAVAAGRGG